MGFIKANNGNAQIDGLDIWKNASTIKNYVGYVPGEIAFPDTRSGQTFLKLQLDLLHQKAHENQKVNDLIQKLKIDTTADIKRMSKGMKQKVALVCAFMTDAKVLLLDEPTTGLDPVMRDVFIDLVKDAKSQQKTILMSSHMFNELEPTCDRIAFLKKGKIFDLLDQKKMDNLRLHQEFKIELEDEKSYQRLLKSNFKVSGYDTNKKIVKLTIHEKEDRNLIQELGMVNVKEVSIKRMGLDDYFAEELVTA